MKGILAAMVAAIFIYPASALAGVVVNGGTPAEQATITQALNASKFPWALAGAVNVTITNDPNATHNHAAWSTPGEVWIQAAWLDVNNYSVMQHEMAHQVDYFTLTDVQRSALNSYFGVTAWLGDETGSDVGTINQYGGERFAEEMTSAYGSYGPNEPLWKPALSFDSELVKLGIIPAPLLHHPKLVCHNVRKVKRVHGKRRVLIQRVCHMQ